MVGAGQGETRVEKGTIADLWKWLRFFRGANENNASGGEACRGALFSQKKTVSGNMEDVLSWSRISKFTKIILCNGIARDHSAESFLCRCEPVADYNSLHSLLAHDVQGFAQGGARRQ